MQFGTAAGLFDTTGIVITAVALTLLLAVIVAAIRTVRAGPRPFRSHPPPPLVVYPDGAHPVPSLTPAGVRDTARDAARSAPRTARGDGAPHLPAARGDGDAAGNEVAALAPARHAVATTATAGESYRMTPDGALVPASAPADGTLQILPGRLEVLSGAELGQDIRFVRSGGGAPELTLGRGAGPPHRHVQIQAPTVSRTHARLRFERNRWSITNLSDVNPVCINGDSLATDASRVLEDGDRVELGEVQLRFRAR